MKLALMIQATVVTRPKAALIVQESARASKLFALIHNKKGNDNQTKEGCHCPDDQNSKQCPSLHPIGLKKILNVMNILAICA
jgi:hypothetical protein